MKLTEFYEKRIKVPVKTYLTETEKGRKIAEITLDIQARVCRSITRHYHLTRPLW
ncbi:MAG: hypothetical protein UT33_C0010G0020 [Candidatus Peregrinibacteria bacterium GW2011_GWC2_39_14]|nr:MAG: hypothetical protein US92_C0006G0020 [Candidatus Peregrinibacteria bacterium GW2011_GWA2_38_36]KKR05877.1 MAG: hypothetical protein UT33_C0010G0020 [Candidatus Peregrinibacteria bacterium GW2011_GWC2_39_14]